MYSIVIPMLSIIYFLENFDILMCVDHYLIYEMIYYTYYCSLYSQAYVRPFGLCICVC